MKVRTPPGRAGRTWLRRRLVVASRAAELLEHKRHELEAELGRLTGVVERTERDWKRSFGEATHWLARVDATGGARALRLAQAGLTGRVAADLTWRSVMGVRYPSDVACRVPDPAGVTPLEGGAALSFAIAAYGEATEDGVKHAAAQAAHLRIVAELRRTRRRLRALEARAVPAYEDALAILELRLDEEERGDLVRAKWTLESLPGADSGERAP